MPSLIEVHEMNA